MAVLLGLRLLGRFLAEFPKATTFESNDLFALLRSVLQLIALYSNNSFFNLSFTFLFTKEKKYSLKYLQLCGLGWSRRVSSVYLCKSQKSPSTQEILALVFYGNIS